jgi:predicted membrane protein
MSLITSIIIYTAGVIIAGLIYSLLRRRISEAIALGIGMTVILLAAYPFVFWLTGGQESFTKLLIRAVIAGLIATGLRSLMKSK